MLSIKTKETIKEGFITRYHNIKFKKMRTLVKNKDITIISNNCWGGHFYRDLNIPYKSPFIGLFINSPDYIKMLKNFEYYMEQDLVFTKKSKLDEGKQNQKLREYPIALLKDIELHFLHYQSEEEALEKWTRRKSRMNWNNMYFKFSEKFNCTPNLIKQFDSLPFQNKLILTKEHYEGLSSAVQLKKFNLNHEMYFYYKYFDLIAWINFGEVLAKRK